MFREGQECPLLNEHAKLPRQLKSKNISKSQAQG